MELNLKQYLKKFEQLLPYETKVRNAVIAAIQDIFKITLERKNITVSGAKVYIQTSSALKSEIRIKQLKILSHIKEKDSSITVTQIL